MDLIQSELVISQIHKHVAIDKLQYVVYFLLVWPVISTFPFLFSLVEHTLPYGEANFFENSRFILDDVLEILIVETRQIIIVF
jgi:hypothetical protein